MSDPAFFSRQTTDSVATALRKPMDQPRPENGIRLEEKFTFPPCVAGNAEDCGSPTLAGSGRNNPLTNGAGEELLVKHFLTHAERHEFPADRARQAPLPCSTLTARESFTWRASTKLFGTAEEAWRCESYCCYFLSWLRPCRFWPRDSAPAIIVQNEGKAEPLGLVGLNVEARIIGYAAETTATMTFANPQARPTQGDLYFPLPEGATVSGYALDIQGNMVERRGRGETAGQDRVRGRNGPADHPGWSNGPARVFPQRVFRFRPAASGPCACSTSASWPTAPGGGATYRLPLSFTGRSPRSRSASRSLEAGDAAEGPAIDDSELPVHEMAGELRRRDETGERLARQRTGRRRARRGKADRVG